MKKIISYIIILTSFIFADDEVNYGITAGAGIGVGVPFTEYSVDVEPEYIITLRPALIMGEDQVFTLGLDYTFRQQNYTITEDSYTSYRTKSETYHSYSHNIGIAMGMNLNRNPVWWSFGFDSYSGGLYLQSTIGLLAGSEENNNGVLFALNTYVSAKKVATGITVNLHWFGDSYKRDKGYENGGAIAGVSTSIIMLTVLAAAAGGAGGSDNNSNTNSNVEISGGTCSIYGCLCNDGTISYAKHRQGACSWHGGIYY